MIVYRACLEYLDTFINRYYLGVCVLKNLDFGGRFKKIYICDGKLGLHVKERPKQIKYAFIIISRKV